MKQLKSRERFTRAIENREVDHVPCCFMSFSILRRRMKQNLYDVCKYEKKMGLDSMLFIPMTSRESRPEHPDLRGLPIKFDRKVKCIEEQIDESNTEKTMRRVYITPKGNLSTEVRISDDWPHGNHVPFIDDYQIPRSLKPLITREEDLEALQFLLESSTEADIAKFREEARDAKEFAVTNDVMLAGGWGVGIDMAAWLCGLERLMVMEIDKPEVIDKLLKMIHKWNMERMKIVMSAGIDIFIRRAWYEGCNFLMPEFYRKHILPNLATEVEFAHDSRVKFGYICTSGLTPMLDYYRDAGIDVLIGIDPMQGFQSNMKVLKERIGDKVSLWGGVSAALTIERGTEADVRREVKNAINSLGPRGFILSPVDNITVDDALTWNNVGIMIDEWKKHCENHAS